ncbi:MAG TPA: DUF3465 domain-containing protein [Candidatus Baltobacteraceae bacterium]|nr:DUF3465 domain-containing protein [Candidatus Baltobacteraceae bacterium]
MIRKAMDLAAAYTARTPAWVDFSATVCSPPRYFYGSRSHAMHEAFDVQTTSGRIEVVDNVSIAPRCPVQSGDRVEIRGEMVHDRNRSPIVHWTHPRHHHNDGFIRLDGKVYA